jgi:PAS domain S-box-containing protein
MFGYGREELLGQTIEILLPETLRKSHVRRRSAYIQGPQARPVGIGMELRARWKDGTEFPVEIGLGPVTTLQHDRRYHGAKKTGKAAPVIPADGGHRPSCRRSRSRF